MAATSITQKMRIDDGKGGWVEFGTFVLDAASIAANAQGVETAAITGAKVGDGIFLNARAMEDDATIAGAKVTDTNEVSIYINNTFDATTAVDLGSLTFDYMLVHYS